MAGTILAVALAILGAAGLSGLVVALIYQLVRSLGDRQRKIRAIWAALAARRHGTFDPGEVAFFQSRPMSVEVPTGDAAALLDTYVVRQNKSSTTYTRVRAQYVMPFGPRFRVYREGVFASIGKALGFQDVVLGGHAEFDRAFIVKTDSPEATARSFDAATKDLLCRVHAGSTLQADGHSIRLTWVGLEQDPRVLDAAIDIVGQLASYGIGFMTRLLELDHGRYHRPEGTWDGRSSPVIEIDQGNQPVYCQPAVIRDRLALCIWSPARRQLPPFHCDLEGGHARPPLPPGACPPQAAALLAALPRGELDTDGRTLRFYCTGFEPLGALSAATKLVAEMAASRPTQGAFR